MSDMVERYDRAFADRMQRCVDNGDTEGAHGDADDLLVELLQIVGFEQTVSAYSKVDKWYA